MFNERVSFVGESVYNRYNSKSISRSTEAHNRRSSLEYRASSIDHTVAPRFSIAFQENINYNEKSDKSNEIKALRMKFFWFAIIASTNHALNYVVTSYASSLLGNKRMLIHNSLLKLYITNIFIYIHNIIYRSIVSWCCLRFIMDIKCCFRINSSNSCMFILGF